jgi:hypothetical protein
MSIFAAEGEGDSCNLLSAGRQSLGGKEISVQVKGIWDMMVGNKFW